MTHIAIERAEAERILHVIKLDAGELRQLGLYLAGKTIKEALAEQAAVQEPKIKDVVVENMVDPFTVKAYDAPQPAHQEPNYKELYEQACARLDALDKALAKYEQPAQQEPWGFHIQFNNGKYATFKGLDKLAECEAHLEAGETITMLYIKGNT